MPGMQNFSSIDCTLCLRLLSQRWFQFASTGQCILRMAAGKSGTPNGSTVRAPGDWAEPDDGAVAGGGNGGVVMRW